VLLNYTGNLRDVMTVAHELGHGVHQYLARDRGLFEQDSPLTTAETASVFGEMLVFRRLLAEEEDPAVRLALVCGKLEDAFATVFRQVVMTRFEEALHAARRAEGELPTSRINELWLEANRPMFGESVTLTEDYGVWWMYIPHFVHSPFYCYAYAFGELLVLALLRRYDAEGAGFVPRYLDLLRAGGSDEPTGSVVTAPRPHDLCVPALERAARQQQAPGSDDATDVPSAHGGQTLHPRCPSSPWPRLSGREGSSHGAPVATVASRNVSGRLHHAHLRDRGDGLHRRRDHPQAGGPPRGVRHVALRGG
jgi:hypothetical protein